MNALVFALVAALGNLAGGYAVVRHERKSLVAIEMALAFGAGFMLSVALLEVAPEAIARDPSAPFYILLGYLAVHLAQHVLVPHFHFGEETHAISPRQGLTALAGLLLHTFFDGVAIASGFLVSGSLGLLLFLAVFLHKLPEGVAMASVMLAGGQGARRALGASALLGVATVAGVLVTE
ncbi:MAG TPA: ZIP family metal transporter, partial [Gemmatimonadales bacterium]|nr:ZIP family metal transporter [Gemmatimonadales bacterium]